MEVSSKCIYDFTKLFLKGDRAKCQPTPQLLPLLSKVIEVYKGKVLKMPVCILEFTLKVLLI